MISNIFIYLFITFKQSDIFGTPNYASPEVLHGQTPGYQSDIFSIGVIIYAMYLI